MLCWFLGAGAIGGLEVWFPLYSALFVARKGVLFSVAVEGLALRACRGVGQRPTSPITNFLILQSPNQPISQSANQPIPLCVLCDSLCPL